MTTLIALLVLRSMQLIGGVVGMVVTETGGVGIGFVAVTTSMLVFDMTGGTAELGSG